MKASRDGFDRRRHAFVALSEIETCDRGHGHCRRCSKHVENSLSSCSYSFSSGDLMNDKIDTFLGPRFKSFPCRLIPGSIKASTECKKQQHRSPPIEEERPRWLRAASSNLLIPIFSDTHTSDVKEMRHQTDQIERSPLSFESDRFVNHS
jgi:hypothetical protein